MLSVIPLVRPIGGLTFALDYRVWGLTPGGYHLTNVILHVLTSLSMIPLMRVLGVEHWRAAGTAAAIVFVLHPIHGGIVPLMTTRFDILLGLCTMLFLAAFARFCQTGRAAHVMLAASFLALGLLCKETAVFLIPLGAVCAIVWPAGTQYRPRRFLVAGGMLVAVTAVYWIYRRGVLGGLGGYEVSKHSLRQTLGVSLWYWRSLALPGPEADAPGTVLMIVLVAMVSAVVWRGTVALWRREPEPVRELRTLYLLSLILACFWGLYSGAYYLTGVYKPFYLYAPAALWCVWLGVACGAFGKGGRGIWRWWLAPCALMVGWWLVWSVRPDTVRFDRWRLRQAGATLPFR
jgi:hypothetical protein